MVIMCCDHRGFILKNKLKKILQDLNYEINDINTEFSEKIDYPVVTKNACAKVLEGLNNYGIFVCGTGTGMNIVANKIKGIRSTESLQIEKVKLSRQKNNCNVLCLGADFVNEIIAKQLVLNFLKTEFSKEQRHIDRINDIE